MRLQEILMEVAQSKFVQQNYDTAKAVGDQLGVDPKIILGHWALETGWGKGVIPGTNNLGNIKDFSGGGVRAYDKVEKSNDAYRAYEKLEDFAQDYANLLARRFPGVIGAGSDPTVFVQGLQGGKYKYATGKQFEKSMLHMPGSVEKYLDPNQAAIQRTTPPTVAAVAPAMMAKKLMPATGISKSTNVSYTDPEPNNQEVEIMINGKRKKFASKKEAMAALAAATTRKTA